MLNEEVHIIGILDETKEAGSIKAEELKTLICYELQLPAYHPVLIEALVFDGLKLEENLKIEIQAIFKALDSAWFIKTVPSYYGKRITKYSIKMLKAAVVLFVRGLLQMREIKDAASVFQMKEYESLTTGVQASKQAVHSMLWKIGKTINDQLLEKWLAIHQRYFEQPGMLMIDEFLYLLCNCVNKQEMFERIPKIPMGYDRDKKFNLFVIDKEFGKSYETPDHRIQHIFNTYNNIDKATLEGVASGSLRKQAPPTKVNRRQTSKIEQTNDNEPDSFRKQLRSMVMTVGIKAQLKEYHQKLIRSRLNGKAAYETLKANLEDANLPKPFVQNKNPKLEIQTPSGPFNGFTFPRPQTALNKYSSPNLFRRQKSIGSKLVSPNISRAPIKILGETDGFEVFKNTSQEPINSVIRPPTSPNKSIRPLSAVSQFNMNVIKLSKRQTSFASICSTNDMEPNSAFENMLDEELSIFENKHKRKQVNKMMSSTYFNSATLSPSNTRIFSSKSGGAVKIPMSPASKKYL